MEQADKFINGEKTVEGNKDEYRQLPNAFDKVLYDLPKDDPLYAKYNELNNLEWQ